MHKDIIISLLAGVILSDSPWFAVSGAERTAFVLGTATVVFIFLLFLEEISQKWRKYRRRVRRIHRIIE